MEGIREITYLGVALRIVAAIIIGGLLGLERGMKNRPAGMRTYMLVCVGACLVMLTNQYVYQVFDAGDPVRMGAQVVSGIGFLGAGTIIVTRRNQIKGLTTAAGLWTSAGVGLALGIGFYEAAFIGGFAVFFVITLLQKMDNNMHRKSRQMEIYFELAADVSLGDFLRAVRDQGLEIYNVQREQGTDARNSRAYIASLKTRKRSHHGDILELVQGTAGVVYMEEL
ncbi:MAG: MgtC/SapB family protein [Oscillospiraceae bacterium]|nr:MgtC/SapB family protein [Oscillospiraceae bacterium]